MSSDIEKNYDDFISTVSHELRTPLTSIRGFSQTMLSSWDKLDDESKKKFIKIIEDQSQRLVHLIENMLAVTKINSGKNIFVYNEIDVKPVIEQTILMVKLQYKTHNFEVNYQENLPKIFVDRDKFQQILTNLFENSAKYSARSSTTNINVKGAGDFVVIDITNTGLNIDKSDYEKVFTKFARIDNPLTRTVQGSGLGLYITKNLVEKMGGEISLNSTPISGEENLSKITFTVSMPVKNIEEQARIKCNQ